MTGELRKENKDKDEKMIRGEDGGERMQQGMKRHKR